MKSPPQALKNDNKAESRRAKSMKSACSSLAVGTPPASSHRPRLIEVIDLETPPAREERENPPLVLQTFELAKDRRLAVDTSLREFPSLEELLERTAGKASRRDAETGAHQQDELLCSELENETQFVLNSLRQQEWERSRGLVADNFEHAFNSWRLQQERINKRFSNVSVPTPNKIAHTVTFSVVKRFSAKIPPLRMLPIAQNICKEVLEETEESDVEDNESVGGTKKKAKSLAVVKKGSVTQEDVAVRKTFFARTIDLPKDKSRGKFKTSIRNDMRQFIQSMYGTWASDARPSQSRIRDCRIFTCVLPKIEPIPRSCTWVHVNVCVHADDEKILRALPYFGDDDFTGVDVSEFEKVPGELEPEIIGEAEELTVCYIIDRHKRDKSTRAEVFSALENCLQISVSEISKAYERVTEGDWYRNTILKQHTWVENVFVNKVESCRLSLKDVSGDAPLLSLVSRDIISLDPDLPMNIQKGEGIGLGINNRSSYEVVNGNLREFFCRRCYVYTCPLHSILHPFPRQRVDPKPPLLTKYSKISLPTDRLREHRRHTPLTSLSETQLIVKNGDFVMAFSKKPTGDLSSSSSSSKSSSLVTMDICDRNNKSAAPVAAPSAAAVQVRSQPHQSQPAVVKGAIVLNAETQRDTRGSTGIDASRFSFADGAIVYASPRTQKEELFLPNTSLADFPDLLKHIVSEGPRTTKESSSTAVTVATATPTHQQCTPAKKNEQVGNATSSNEASTNDEVGEEPSMNPLVDEQSAETLERFFKSKLPALSQSTGPETQKKSKNKKNTPSRVRGRRSLSSPFSSSSAAVPLIDLSLDAKAEAKLSFTPPLTNVEIALVERLCLMFESYKPAQKETESGSSTDDKNERMIAFVRGMLATRSEEEIRRIIEQKDVFFPSKTEAPAKTDQPPLPQTPATAQKSMKAFDTSETINLASEEDDEEEPNILKATPSSTNRSNHKRKFFNLVSDEEDESDVESIASSFCANNGDSKRPKTTTTSSFESLPTGLQSESSVTGTVDEGMSAKRQKGGRGGRRSSKSNGDKAQAPKLKKNSFKHAYEPCNHEGPCSRAKDCVCFLNGTFCEKYCGCSEDCKNRFPGCFCKGGCKTNSCPCFAASRACDPDVCGECGAAVPIVFRPLLEKYLLAKRLNLCFSATEELPIPAVTAAAAVSGEDNGFRLCSNLALHHRPQKKIFVGRSLIHGWGAFAAEDIERHEFIGEYTGEVISQEEAERRGNVYDKMNMSYLFTLNNEQVVDGTRKGNFTKFINHCKEKPNCCVRIVQVNGDHKIGIFGKRNIKTGEELTFDYNYTTMTAPEWSGASAKSGKSGSRKKREQTDMKK